MVRVFFSSTSGVRQFYLVLWLTEINGRIEEPHEEEMASVNEKLALSLIDISVLMEASMPFFQHSFRPRYRNLSHSPVGAMCLPS